MSDYLLSSIHVLLTVLAVMVLAYTLWKWQSLPVLRRMLGLQFFAVVLHTWEEMRFPGGFIELVQHKLHFSLANQNFGELVLALAILAMFIPTLVFPRRVFLAMMPMVLGVMEAVVHTAAIWMFNLKVPYSPGLATALCLMLPISVYTIRYAIQHKLVRPIDWVYSFLCMLLILLTAQMIVVESSGMSYLEFLANIRKSVFKG